MRAATPFRHAYFASRDAAETIFSLSHDVMLVTRYLHVVDFLFRLSFFAD